MLNTLILVWTSKAVKVFTWMTIIASTVALSLYIILLRQQRLSPTHPNLSLNETIANPVYPLKVSTNGRYLVDQNNEPFLIVGDSPQALVANLSEADANYFLANRKAAGYNTVWVNLICLPNLYCNTDGRTVDGIPPFTTPGDLSTPNDAYFTRADRIIQLAGMYGIVVILDPIETSGWLPTLRSNGETKAYNYGVFLGNRYKDFQNIIWMSGNDFQTWEDSTDDALVLAVANGIKSADSNHLHTVGLNYYSSNSLSDPNWAPIVSLNAAYTYYPTYAEVLNAYNQAGMPVFMVEANYEFENNTKQAYGSPLILRMQEYWSMLSGATGQLYGNYYTWQFHRGWKNNIDTLGSIQFIYSKNLFSTREWWNLVPDQNHNVVTSGYGTFSNSDLNIGSNDYLTAARTSDGKLAIAYMPTIRTIEVDMSKLSGVITARWYDPTNGTYKIISDSPFSNSGIKQFAPPGRNSSGDGDWVLVLEANTNTTPTSTSAIVTIAPSSTVTFIATSTNKTLTLTSTPTVMPSTTQLPLDEGTSGKFILLLVLWMVGTILALIFLFWIFRQLNTIK